MRVSGVQPALARTLEHQLATEVGMMVSDAPLRDDLRRLFESGVVADAQVELVGDDQIEFVVEPRAKIGRVIVRGGDPQMARRFRLLEGAPYEPARLRRMAEQAQVAYVRAGRLEATVEARRETTGAGVSVCVAATPGPKLTISEIAFPGRAAIPATTLTAAMRSTSNRVGSVFDPGDFAIDKLRLEAVYWDRGHANVRVGDPRPIKKGHKLVVEIPIDEGPMFRFGTVSARARLDTPIALTRGDVFGRDKVDKAIAELRARPGIEDALPSIKLDTEHRTVDVTFEIRWRWPWFALSHWLSR